MLWTEPIKRNNDFRRLYARGKSSANKYLVVYAMKNRNGQSRLGITASKKLGSAVERNRARRLIRESVRLCEDRIKHGFDMVIVARYRSVKAKRDEVESEMMRALDSLGLVEKNK